MAALIAVAACHRDPVPHADGRTPGREIATARIVATGDLLMHGRVKRSAEQANVVTGGVSTNHEGYDALWAGVTPAIAAADLAFANLETPIAPETGSGGRSMVFNAPVVLLESLRATGFDVVSFANNHVYDQGRDGLVETLDHLAASGLVWVGAGDTCAEALRAQILVHDGLRIALLGATDLFNDPLNAGPGEPCAATLDEAAILAEVARVRAEGPAAVILSLHWGIEYETLPREADTARAHRLVEGGVDLILGHHPHVLQRIEEIHTTDGRTGIVAYSLGNFVSNQSAWYEPDEHDVSDGYPRDGVLLGVTFVQRRTNGVDHVEIADVVATPLWTSNATRHPDDDPMAIHVDPTADLLAALDVRRAETTDPESLARIDAERAELEARLRAVRETLGERWVPGD